MCVGYTSIRIQKSVSGKHSLTETRIPVCGKHVTRGNIYHCDRDPSGDRPNTRRAQLCQLYGFMVNLIRVPNRDYTELIVHLRGYTVDVIIIIIVITV